MWCGTSKDDISTRIKEAVEAMFYDKPDKVFEQFKNNVKTLGERDRRKEDYIPFVPRLFLIDARQSFIFSQYVACVLLSGLAIEMSLRDFLEGWFKNRVKDPDAFSSIREVLEEFDYRKMVSLCKEHKFLAKDVYSDLHRCYDIRTKYSHGKLTSILGKLAEEPITSSKDGKIVETHPLKEDDFLAAIVATDVSACDDALEIFRLATKALEVIYIDSGDHSPLSAPASS